MKPHSLGIWEALPTIGVHACTLYDIPTVTNSPNNTYLRECPCVKWHTINTLAHQIIWKEKGRTETGKYYTRLKQYFSIEYFHSARCN